MTASFPLQCSGAFALYDPLALLAPAQESTAFPALIGVLVDTKKEPEEEGPPSDHAFPGLVFWQPPAAAPLMIFAPLETAASEPSPDATALVLPPEPPLKSADAAPIEIPCVHSPFPGPAPLSDELTLAPATDAGTPVTVEVETGKDSPRPASPAVVELIVRPKPGVQIQAPCAPAARSARKDPQLRPSADSEQPSLKRATTQAAVEQPEDTRAEGSEPAIPARSQPRTPTPPESAQAAAPPAPVPEILPARSGLVTPPHAAQKPPPGNAGPGGSEAVQEPERVEAPRPLAQLSLRVSPPGRPSVLVRLVEKQEGIHVRFLTNDESMAAPLRRELPQLIRQLDRQGLTVDSPVAGGSAPGEERRERSSPYPISEETATRDTPGGSPRDGRRHSDASPDEAPETPRRIPRNSQSESGFHSIVSAVSAAFTVQTGDSKL